MKIPRLIINSSKDFFGIINCLLVLLTAFNKQIAEIFKVHWQGISPKWSVLFIIILAVRALVRAMYEDRQELYLAYEAVKVGATKAGEKYQNEIDQLKNQLSNNNTYMSFKTVFSKFKEELERESPEDYHSMGSIMKRQSEGQENQFVMRFGQSIDVDIYGQIPSTSFRDWVKIDKDLFFVCTIKNGLELYRNNVLEYTDLAINKSDLEKAINESKLYLSDEFMSRLYKITD